MKVNSIDLLAIFYHNFTNKWILVCQSLISNGERYEEESFLGRARLETLRSLCRMYPNQILTIRLKCVSDYSVKNSLQITVIRY